MGLKEKILDASYELFGDKGYDETTVSDIIKKAGSSRGGFYHHFNSKEEILEAITEEYLDEFSKLYNTTIEEHVGSYTELFNKIFTMFYEYKMEQIRDWPKLQKVFSFKGNHVIILKIAREFEELTTKVYTKVIREGVDKGEFTVKYHEALAGLWTREMIQINRIARKEFFKHDEVKFKSLIGQLEFVENMINRELGLKGNGVKVKLVVLAYIEHTKEQIALKEEDAR
ncbi:TetR/AcrR family transcriptional regulator [Wukongibacter baidiensis]|uniref:TetR/AcrR family transcriptional regulator n=1 Tax=Wukongibacter baidiensis TaxID=1723361 RepID=UPI003D7FCF53